MASRNPTYYEILGIRPNAKHTDVGLAYNRKSRALRREDAPPDLKAESKLREAFEVLADLDRRAEYDEKLRVERRMPAFGRNHAAFAALFVVAIAAGLYWYLRPQLTPEAVDVPAAPGKPFHEILEAAIPAVGRLQTVDISGRSRPAGIAFAVEEGVLVTSCQGLSPTAQLNVDLAPRVIPARVTVSDDALGLCKLEVVGAGSWPLSISAVPAKAGDRVYAAHLGAGGELILREARVRAIKPGESGPVIEVTVPLLERHGGAPLLDIHGRVVAVASMPPDRKGAYVPIPPAWAEMPKAAASQPVVEGPPAETEGKPGEVDEIGVPLETRRKQEELARKIDPKRRERLEKAFRPPPSVPEDL